MVQSRGSTHLILINEIQHQKSRGRELCVDQSTAFQNVHLQVHLVMVHSNKVLLVMDHLEMEALKEADIALKAIHFTKVVMLKVQDSSQQAVVTTIIKGHVLETVFGLHVVHKMTYIIVDSVLRIDFCFPCKQLSHLKKDFPYLIHNEVIAFSK